MFGLRFSAYNLVQSSKVSQLKRPQSKSSIRSFNICLFWRRRTSCLLPRSENTYDRQPENKFTWRIIFRHTRKTAKATTSFVMSMSVGMYQHDSHRTDVQESSYLRFLLELVDILQFWLKVDRNNYNVNTVEPGYSDIGLSDASFTTSDVLWFQFLTANHNIVLLGYNDTKLYFVAS